MPKILCGYYIKARIIQESEIANSPPHFREIWDWLMANANHKNKKVSGRIVKRGQCFTSKKEILDGLKWKVGYRIERYKNHQYENAMKFLRSRSMIAVTKTVRGIIVTIINYDKYQDPKNYESRDESRDESRTPPSDTETINKNDKNDKNDKKKHILCPHLKIIEIYHKKLPMLPIVQSHTEDLKKRVRVRWREDPQRQTLEWWEWYFQDVLESDFLVGKVKDWAATFYWLVGPKNMTKVLNGEYINRDISGQKIRPTTYAQFQDVERRSIPKIIKEMRSAGKSEGDSGGAPQVEHILPGGEEVP